MHKPLNNNLPKKLEMRPRETFNLLLISGTGTMNETEHHLQKHSSQITGKTYGEINLQMSIHESINYLLKLPYLSTDTTSTLIFFF